MELLFAFRFLQENRRLLAINAVTWWLATALVAWYISTQGVLVSSHISVIAFVVVMLLGTFISTLLAIIGYMGADNKKS